MNLWPFGERLLLIKCFDCPNDLEKRTSTNSLIHCYRVHLFDNLKNTVSWLIDPVVNAAALSPESGQEMLRDHVLLPNYLRRYLTRLKFMILMYPVQSVIII